MTITTPNMLEVAYFLERHHQITQVAIQTAWPYGIQELAVTMEGPDIDLDHQGFLRHGFASLAQVIPALAAVQTALEARI